MHLGVSAGPLPGFSDSLHHYNHVLTFAKILGVFNSRPVTTLQASFGIPWFWAWEGLPVNVLVYPGSQFQESWWVLAPPTARRLHPSKPCRAWIRHQCQSNRG